MEPTLANNLKSVFRTCDLYPLDRIQVLKKLPQTACGEQYYICEKTEKDDVSKMDIESDEEYFVDWVICQSAPYIIIASLRQLDRQEIVFFVSSCILRSIHALTKLNFVKYYFSILLPLSRVV